MKGKKSSDDNSVEFSRIIGVEFISIMLNEKDFFIVITESESAFLFPFHFRNHFYFYHLLCNVALHTMIAQQ